MIESRDDLIARLERVFIALEKICAQLESLAQPQLESAELEALLAHELAGVTAILAGD